MYPQKHAELCQFYQAEQLTMANEHLAAMTSAMLNPEPEPEVVIPGTFQPTLGTKCKADVWHIIYRNTLTFTLFNIWDEGDCDVVIGTEDDCKGYKNKKVRRAP